MRRSAYWIGTVSAVAGVVTFALLAVGLPWDELTADDGGPAVLEAVFFAALATGGLSLVTAPVAALLGEKRMALYGALGPLAWALTYGYWYATVE